MIKGLKSHGFEGVGEFARVTLGARLLFRRNGTAEQIRSVTVEPGRRMSMGRTDCDTGRIDMPFVMEPLDDLIADGGRDAAVLDGDENGGRVGVAADSEGFGPKVLGDAF